MKIVFCGTPAFALPALQALAARGWVSAVVTQPGKPKGRGLEVQSSEIALWAKANGLKVLEPERLRSIKDELLALDMDMLVVAAYGKLIPPWLLAHPREGCINIHASLLPRWRGASPIHRSLIEGDTHAGISIMQMEQGLDTGGYWLQKHVEITPNTTMVTLHDTLAELGSMALCEVIEKQLHRMPPTPQDETLVTHAVKIVAEDFAYNPHYTSLEIHRRLQAFYPKPGLRAMIGGHALRLIWSGARRYDVHDYLPGTLLSIDDEGLWIATLDGSLAITELQLASQPARSVASIRQGWPKALALGQVLQPPQ